MQTFLTIFVDAAQMTLLSGTLSFLSWATVATRAQTRDMQTKDRGDRSMSTGQASDLTSDLATAHQADGTLIAVVFSPCLSSLSDYWVMIFLGGGPHV